MTGWRTFQAGIIIACASFISTAGLCRADAGADASVTLEQVRQLRKEAAHRKRRLVFHSDGIPWASSMLQYMPGTQTDACTYSLIHQFNLARNYRSDVAQLWPPEDPERDREGAKVGLTQFIEFCRTNRYEAIWTQRMNDTHDAAGYDDARQKFAVNEFKQKHPEFLVGELKSDTPTSPDGKWSRDDFIHVPHGRWSSVDYSHKEVRDQLIRTWEEVCRNHDIDGLMFDFFRHLTFFRSTALGGHATDDEVEKMTELLRRTRRMADEVGAQRGRPVLLLARTPDLPAYARAVGLDIEQWMKEGLIDIWIATGYFRLQEWTDIVAMAHGYGVPVWAGMSESRVEPRDLHNSIEAFRARAMNMWNAGVDALYLFNFSFRTRPQFRLLFEIGDPERLAHLDKMYVPDARGFASAGEWLKGGDAFYTRPQSLPQELSKSRPKAIVNILIGDDLSVRKAKDLEASPALGLQFKDIAAIEGLNVMLNGTALKWQGGTLDANFVRYELSPTWVKKGVNAVEITYETTDDTKLLLTGLQLWIKQEYMGVPFDTINRVRYQVGESR